MTSAWGMNEQEPVLTQLPLRIGAGGAEVARGQRAGAEHRSRLAGVREPGRDQAESKERGMERRRPRTCLALLWGCMLVATAAQGKEGEFVCAAAAPARPSPGCRRPKPRRLLELRALRRAQLWKPTWRRPAPERWGWEARGPRLGQTWDPPSHTRGFRS